MLPVSKKSPINRPKCGDFQDMGIKRPPSNCILNYCANFCTSNSSLSFY
jgi:hypothetical protein